MREDSQPFYQELESLRGFAALSVVIYHVVVGMMFLGTDDRAPVVIERIGGAAFAAGLAGISLFNGRAAVPLFFVLSGFVMGIGLARMERIGPRPYVAFLVRRFFRLMPALWASILFGVAVQIYLGNKYDAATLFRFFTLLDNSINPVEWSLILEIAACLVYPLIVVVFRRAEWPAQAALVIGAAVVQSFHLIRVNWGITSNDLPLYCFCLGVSIPTLGRTIMQGLPKPVAGSGAALALCGLLSTPFVTLYVDYYLAPLNGRITYGMMSLGVPTLAFYIIAWLIYVGSPVVMGTLRSRPLVFLGTTSYSIYILHGPIMALSWTVVAPQQSPWARFAVGCALVIPATLLLAALSYHWIEKSSIAFGKHIAAAVQRRPSLARV